MAGPDELERMIKHVAGDVQKAEEAHGVLEKGFNAFLIADARSRAELAGYIRNAASDIKAVRTSSEKSTETLAAAIDTITTTLTKEITDRSVEDEAAKGRLKIAKTDLEAKIRMSGYAKIISLLAAGVLAALAASGFLG